MSDLSFKNFVLASGFELPVSALVVAKSLNMSPPPPVSMRAMIATAAPFVPYDLLVGVATAGVAVFGWSDPATPFLQPQNDSLRAATSFEFKLWSWPTSASSILVDDAILPLTSVILGNGSMEYFPGVLDGAYTYQITAINPFGTASTSVQTAQFAPPSAAPIITVVPAGTNVFKVDGTGFDTWNGQSIVVEADAGVPTTLTVRVATTVSHGAVATNVNTAGICEQAGGGPLLFYATLDTGPGTVSPVISNKVPASCS
jgi:hypothetical protein